MNAEKIISNRAVVSMAGIIADESGERKRL
jgi:hypothetical protein